MNLSCLPVLLAGVIALVLWRWAISHLALLGRLLEHLALIVLAVLLNTTPCGIISGFRVTLTWIVTLWLLGWLLSLLPGKGGALGTWLRGLPSTVLKIGGRGAAAVLRVLVRSLRRAIWPSSQKKPDDIRDKN